MARGIEGWPWAVARAGARPGSFVATVASRSGIEAGAERSKEGGGVAVVTGRGELGSWRRHSWPGGGRSVVAAGDRGAARGRRASWPGQGGAAALEAGE